MNIIQKIKERAALARRKMVARKMNRALVQLAKLDEYMVKHHIPRAERRSLWRSFAKAKTHQKTLEELLRDLV